MHVLKYKMWTDIKHTPKVTSDTKTDKNLSGGWLKAN